MWFTVSLFLRTDVERENDVLWEERIILMRADTEGEARERAEQIGRRSEHSYTVRGGGTVTWRFVQVERVHAIDTDALTTDTEVFSRYLRPSEAMSLLRPFEDDEET